MRGLITCGTSLILLHKPNKIAGYSLKRLLTPPSKLKLVCLGCNKSQGD